ncbi:MAG: hypothetical protein AB1Z98_03725 [Nannocystaceae bacterium]
MSGEVSGEVSGEAGRRWTLGLALALASACTPDDLDTRGRVADYLLPDPYPRLVIEVDAVEGLTLPDGVSEPLMLAVEELVDKPDGVELVMDQTLAATGRRWSSDALHELADARFDLAVDDDTTKLHVLLLDGSYVDGDGDELLGLQWGHRHVAMFREGLLSACRTGRGGRGLSSNACQSAELGVLAHELGHALGLVDNGVPMVTDHEDPEHRKHTDDPDCVMFWTYERRAVVTRIEETIDSGVPAEEAVGFCAPSLADIEAYKARG